MGFWSACKNLLKSDDSQQPDVAPSIYSHLAMRQWGIQDKTPLPDTGLREGQGLYNRPLIRPAYSRFLLNRSMSFVAPGHKTPWPSVNWVPTPPYRTHQVTKSGGRAPQHPGMITVAQMQQYHRSVPTISSGLSGFSDAINAALYGS